MIRRTMTAPVHATPASARRSRLLCPGAWRPPLAALGLWALAAPAAWAACPTAIVNLPEDRPDSRYEVAAGVTPAGSAVRDMGTNLIWARCVVGMDWDATANTCVVNNAVAQTYTWFNALTLTPPTGWRLPNVSELASLASKACASGPTINVTWFPATPVERHWSNTEVLGDASAAWVVSFANAQVLRDQTSNGLRVRWVKDGP